MKVLLVHNYYQQAGGEDQVFADEGKLLESNGHSVARFTMHNDSVDAMGRIELARKTIWNKEVQQSLRRIIRESHAEVVHFHNTFPLISPAAYYTAHEEGAAVVQTLHNYRLLCPAATLYRAGGVCEECVGRRVAWPAVQHACYHESRAATGAITAMLAAHRLKGTWQREVDLYIALTGFAAAKFVEGGLPADKIVVKPNFVDPDPGIGLGGGDFALFVGRLTEEKGIPILLKAWEILKGHNRIALKLLGDGPLRKDVEAASASNKEIQYLGRRPLGQVYDMMGAAQILAFPSQWYEGQPRTILESFAKGTPVVACRLGSMSELVDDNRTGFLFAPGDAKDLASKIGLFQSDRTDVGQMRLQARSEFEQRYTALQNYPILIECYKKALVRSGRASGSSGSDNQDRTLTP